MAQLNDDLGRLDGRLAEDNDFSDADPAVIRALLLECLLRALSSDGILSFFFRKIIEIHNIMIYAFVNLFMHLNQMLRNC